MLDLDETLVHSSFKVPAFEAYSSAVSPFFILQPIPNADFIIPVEIDNTIHQVYVLKRPGVDQFLKTMAERFELVVFTASLAKVCALSRLRDLTLNLLSVCGPRVRFIG